MKKFLTLLTLLLIPLTTQAEMLQAGVSVNELPKEFFGTWCVRGRLDTTNSRHTFKPQSMDFWTLKRIDDSVVLDNPMTGAKAGILIDSVQGNLITFTRVTDKEDSKALIDSVTIRIEQNSFNGINTLQLESYSLIDGHLMKKENATYLIKGEKVSNE